MAHAVPAFHADPELPEAKDGDATLIQLAVRRTRLAMGLTQTQFAAVAELPVPTVTAIEQGRARNPTYDIILKLVRVGINPQILFPSPGASKSVSARE